jgi:hypothetical protein
MGQPLPLPSPLPLIYFLTCSPEVGQDWLNHVETLLILFIEFYIILCTKILLFKLIRHEVTRHYELQILITSQLSRTANR